MVIGGAGSVAHKTHQEYVSTNGIQACPGCI
jgi:hypothetical protein